MKIRAIVIDDTSLFRTIVSDALKSIPDVEVIATAASGKAGLEKIVELKPDIITLDIEMPGMNGIQVIDEIKKSGLSVGIILISSLTQQGGTITIQALQKGAFDFITKPTLDSIEKNKIAIQESLTPILKAYCRKLEISTILRGPQATPLPKQETKPAPNLSQIAAKMQNLIKQQKPDMLLIGVSTGGPTALATLLPLIKKDIGVPILIVQHMPPLFTKALAESLSNKCGFEIHEAVNNEELKPSVIYLAPGGKHMKLSAALVGKKSLVITDDPPENNCKPSVDYLFRSAANLFPGKSMAVILTGMGNDGTLGLKLLKRHGCVSLCQNESSCIVYGMPKAAYDAGVIDEVLSLEQIADRINSVFRKGSP